MLFGIRNKEAKHLKFINRDDNALTLNTETPEQINFVYQSKKHAFLFGIFAISLAYVVFQFSDEIKNTHIYVYWFCCFLAGALFFGTISTFLTNCNLEIDKTKKQVRYSLFSLFGKDKWERNFDAFKEIKIYRPISGPNSAGHAAFLKILLTTNKGEEIPLGTGMLGTANQQKVKQLTNKLSEIMSLNVIEESSLD